MTNVADPPPGFGWRREAQVRGGFGGETLPGAHSCLVQRVLNLTLIPHLGVRFGVPPLLAPSSGGVLLRERGKFCRVIDARPVCLCACARVRGPVRAWGGGVSLGYTRGGPFRLVAPV